MRLMYAAMLPACFRTSRLGIHASWPAAAEPECRTCASGCSPNIVSSAESSAAGIQRITKFLRKFSSFPHVFEAAISKLSNNFVVDLCMASRDAEKKAMLKEDRVEQCKQGRYYLEYMSDRKGTFWEPPTPYYNLGNDLDKLPKMVRVWLTEYQFLHGRMRKGPLGKQFPHVTGEELRYKYLADKPGQPRCAECGRVYLWRSQPKLWELACWQIVAPYEAAHPFAQKCLNLRSRTFGQSWYYFNGKPVSCSLCTVVSCASCGKVFNWGDQFRRDFCLCGAT